MSENGEIRDKLGRILPGHALPGAGRPKDTPADKIRKKAQKELIAEYKEGLVEALQLISPVMIAKALEGDISAIKEVNDRALGKAAQSVDMTSKGDKLETGVVVLPSKE